MKRIVLFALAIAGYMTASAQLFCPEKGKVMLYKSVDNTEKTPIETVIKTTVVEVQDADGKQTSRVEVVHPVPDNPLAELKTYTNYIYDPATDVTTVIPMTGDDLRSMIVTTITEAARAANQHLSEQELRDMEKIMSVKGDLQLAIDPKAAVDTKIPQSTLRLNAGQMTMVMNIWDAKYLGTESVTTEAGTFECAKVSYVLRANGPSGGEKDFMTEWYAKGIGMVKSVKSDKKGNALVEETLFVIK